MYKIGAKLNQPGFTHGTGVQTQQHPVSSGRPCSSCNPEPEGHPVKKSAVSTKGQIWLV